MIIAGQSYISVTPEMLFEALRLDGFKHETNEYFETALRSIGGEEADMRSHIDVAGKFLVTLWDSAVPLDVRNAVTSRTLHRLLYQRQDYREFLLYLLAWLRDHTSMSSNSIMTLRYRTQDGHKKNKTRNKAG